jgi:hypothetical protein
VTSLLSRWYDRDCHDYYASDDHDHDETAIMCLAMAPAALAVLVSTFKFTTLSLRLATKPLDIDHTSACLGISQRNHI